MAINPTPPGVPPPRPQESLDPKRGDHMNPYGRARGAMTNYWVIGGLVALVLVIGFFFMRQEPATQPPTSQTSEETVPTQPVPVTPTQPEPTTPTQP